MSFVRLLVDGESKDESEQSNNEQPVRAFSNELREEVEMLVTGQARSLIKPLLENIICRLVRDVTESATERLRTSMNRNSGNVILNSEPQILKLQFVNKIPLVIFTREKIESEESAPIEIALVDGHTDQVVKSGPLASAKVEIVVLKGDFGGSKGDDWTVEEFESKIVKDLPGRKSILIGNELNLKEGIAFVSELSFTHNSSWVAISNYRLGAKVVDHLDGIRVKEAKTEPFTLKDFRIKYREKHNSLSPNDEVWRLRRIGKNGPFHKRLIEANVKTVQDFLNQLLIDPQVLKRMHNGGDKVWTVIEGHARECIIDKMACVYPSPSSVPISELSQTQKADARKSAVSAFEHQEDVVSYPDEIGLIQSSSGLLNDNDRSNSTRVEAPTGNHLQTSNMVGHGDVASTSSLLCSSSMDMDEIWSPSSVPIGHGDVASTSSLLCSSSIDMDEIWSLCSVPIDELLQTQKADAHKLVVSAFEHWEDVVSYPDESELIINSSAHLFNDNDPSNSIRVKAPTGNHLQTSNIVGNGDVASTSSLLCFSSIDMDEIWSAIDKARKKWKVVSGVLKFVTNKRTLAIEDIHIQKKMRCC